MFTETNKLKFVVSKPLDYYSVTVYMDYREVEGGYECDVYNLRMTEKPSYSTLINALIREKYSSDKMEAIINNYLLDADEEAKKEFVEMQAWRRKVKEFAREVFE